MGSQRRAPVLALAVALSLAGCHTVPDGLFGERRAGPSIRIEVTNLNFQDATLHAMRGGERHRLGTVTGKAEAIYTLAWPNPLPLQLEVDLLAGDRCITRPRTVDPGERIAFQIDTDLRSMPDCAPISR